MLLEWVTGLITNGISVGGYFALFILMALESMIAPVPSELVMPFAGFLVAENRFTLLGVAFVSSLGSVFGSLISYWMGVFGGRKFVTRFGRYLLLDEGHLQWTERWFQRAGDKTIFISRFVPVVRHLISIPAGIGRMELKKFVAYTFCGAFLWNLFLAWLGMLLREKWELVHTYSKQLDYIVIAVLVLLCIWFVWKLKKKH